MRSRGMGQRPGDKAFEGRAIMRSEHPGGADGRAEGGIEGEGVTGQLIQTSGEPLVAHIEAHEQPEPGHTGISKQEPGNGRLCWRMTPRIAWGSGSRLTLPTRM